MMCDFKACTVGALNLNDARVEIKSAVPKGGISKCKDSFRVHWKKNGEAKFHRECWEHLLLASAQRKRKKVGNELTRELCVLSLPEKEMIQSAADTAEKFDSDDSVQEAAIRIASLMKSSSHCVLFTGAGISTSAGLGDFRGKDGKWTEEGRSAINIEINEDDSSTQDNLDDDDGPPQPKRLKLPYNLRNGESSTCPNGESSTCPNKDAQQNERNIEEEEDQDEEIAYEELRPTYTHEAISKLVELGHIKYVVSQNCDGLHLMSGVPPSKISELHGNVFVEYCEKCKERYERSYYVLDDVSDAYLEEIEDDGESDIIPPKFMRKCRKCGLSHRTGRKCEKKNCNGHLVDTIINFRDNLEEDILNRAFDSARSCDLLICLGTTLTVTPACGIVDLIKKPRRLVICNRQATERDDICKGKDKAGMSLGARVYTDCDTFMRYLMTHLVGDKLQEFETGCQIKKAQYDAMRS